MKKPMPMPKKPAPTSKMPRPGRTHQSCGPGGK